MMMWGDGGVGYGVYLNIAPCKISAHFKAV